MKIDIKYKFTDDDLKVFTHIKENPVILTIDTDYIEDEDDIDNGFDDYMNIDAYKWDGERPLMEVINDIRENDGYIDDIYGLEDTDSGMMLIKRADHNNSGDIRDYLENSLDFGEYKTDDVESLYKDLIFITAHS